MLTTGPDTDPTPVSASQPAGALYISDADVRALLDVRSVLDVVEQTFRWAYEGRITWPEPRLFRLDLAEPAKAKYHVKGASLPDLGVSGVRVVGYRIFPDGSGTSRDDNMRYVLLHDPVTGFPLAIVDEHTSYGIRSAASGVVGAKYLARPDSAVVGLVGAGKLMRAALVALAALFPLQEARVTSRTEASRKRFAEELAEAVPGVRIVAVDTPTAACKDADIVMSATTSGRPLMEASDFAPGVFVCGLGQREVAPDAFATFEKVVVDDWEQVRHLSDFRAMAAGGHFDRDRLYGELPEIVVGAKPGREHPSERILTRTEGLVTQDIAVSHWLYQEAVRQGRGLRLP
ncbi:MAG: ornithine cyclodeaminase family protein [Chloroflexi bacterium]|nr:ornithine cyclodeaminase family protein [Chloroflexota bacterium]